MWHKVINLTSGDQDPFNTLWFYMTTNGSEKAFTKCNRVDTEWEENEMDRNPIVLVFVCQAAI